jgi:hypothetical protein
MSFARFVALHGLTIAGVGARLLVLLAHAYRYATWMGRDAHTYCDGYYSWTFARSMAFGNDIDLTSDYALCGDPFSAWTKGPVDRRIRSTSAPRSFWRRSRYVDNPQQKLLSAVRCRANQVCQPPIGRSASPRRGLRFGNQRDSHRNGHPDRAPKLTMGR